MIEFFRRHSLSITSIFLLIAAAQLMSLSIANRELPQFGARLIGGGLTPISQLYHESLESVRFTWSRYLWLIEVEKERNSLEQRVKELEKSNSSYIEMAKENERLRALLDLKEENNFTALVAQVIGRSTSNWIHTATINVGESSGVKPGMAVVDGHGLVGQTTAVNANSAIVLLITDNNSAVDSIIQRTRASGIVEGVMGKKLALRYALRQDDILVGDRVITSGLDGVFPKGIVVGTITSVKQESQGLFQVAKLRAAVDFNRLESVMVIKQDQPAILSESELVDGDRN